MAPARPGGSIIDTQSLATLSLLVPTLVVGVFAWRARRQGRTTFGLGLRDGAAAETGRGLVWGIVTAGVFLGLLAGTGVVTLDGYAGGWVSWAGIAAYFLLLFLVEEIVFRGVLLTGLGVLIGPVAAIAVMSVLVALPYSLSPGTSVLAVVGAVVTYAVNGVARLRTGRIWFGFGWRWVLNIAFLAFGFSDAGFRLDRPVVAQHVSTPAWISGGQFGPEAGVVGIALELVVGALMLRFAHGRTGPWRVAPRSRSAASRPAV